MSCCNTPILNLESDFDVTKAVTEAYSARALKAGEQSERMSQHACTALAPAHDACHPGSKVISEAFGYSPEELKAIPEQANMGLSCGNPTAAAKLKEVDQSTPQSLRTMLTSSKGERVLDLGSGGGIDVFLVASKVGPTGQAIGLDGSTVRLHDTFYVYKMLIII